MNEAEYYLDLINRLLLTKDYDWAADTLSGIAATVHATGRLSMKQKQAIDHIMVGRLKHDVGGQ